MTDTIKPRYINWYEEAFQAEPAVRRMKSLARHFYRALLIQAFYCSTRPYLPDDDAELWILADAENEEQWMEHAKSVRRMFQPVVIEGVKLLSQKRLLKEWAQLEVQYSGKGRATLPHTPVPPSPYTRTEQTRTDLNRPEPNIDYPSAATPHPNTASDQASASASGSGAPSQKKKAGADVGSVQVSPPPAAHGSAEKVNPIGSGKAVYAKPFQTFEDEEEENVTSGMDSEKLVNRYWVIAKSKPHCGIRTGINARLDEVQQMSALVSIHGVQKITMCLDQLGRSDYWGATEKGKIDGIRGFGKALETIYGQAVSYVEKVRASKRK